MNILELLQTVDSSHIFRESGTDETWEVAELISILQIEMSDLEQRERVELIGADVCVMGESQSIQRVTGRIESTRRFER